MAPKKQKTQAAGSAETVQANICNKEYLAEVSSAILTIRGQWQQIESTDPLPLVGGTSLESGFLAPWDPDLFDSLTSKGPINSTCGINLFWQNSLLSTTPHVPISKARVLEQSTTLQPDVPLKPPLVVAVNFQKGADLPRGNLIRVSADELVHALLFRVADRIKCGAEASELEQWRRVLLSVPCTFRTSETEDDMFALSASFRVEQGNAARAVTYSARQIVYNIAGFKARKGPQYSSEQIAIFWAENVSESTGGEQLRKKSTIDAALTISERFLALLEVEQAVSMAEESRGAESCWNSIWKMQELISRCRKPALIIWAVECIEDQIR